MVKRRDEFPDGGEMVICTVKDINPNSIFVKLEEYGKEGMIHISNVANKWVKDIRNWASEGEKKVCLVKSVDKGKGHIDLSLKDVPTERENRRMQTWKRDERGEDFLELMAEREDMSLDEAYEKIGYDLQESFKDMLEPFEIAVKKGREELMKRGVDEKWTDVIKGVGEDKIKRKEEEINKTVDIRSWSSDGAETIRNSLETVADEFGINVKYMSAPEYEFSARAKDPKEGEEMIKKAVEKLKGLVEGEVNLTLGQ